MNFSDIRFSPSRFSRNSQMFNDMISEEEGKT